MAENVAVTTIEIRGTEKVATSMKELKQQISDYRDKLIVLGQAEEETEEILKAKEDTIEKLRKATKLLSDATNAHKQSAEQEQKVIDVQKDSYNDLQREMSKLKKEYKDMVSAERDSPMGEETLRQIQELDIKLKELDAGMGQFQRNVGNYGMTFTQAMGEARQSMGYVQQGLGPVISGLGVMGVQNEGLTKSLTAVSLALQLFTNEGVQKSIIKIKEWISAKIAARAAAKAAAAEAKANAAAMTGEAVATNTATVATNAFKKALIATGIGAIIVLIGTLIANLDKLASMFAKSGDDAVKSFEDAKTALEELEAEMERSVEMLEARGATQSEVLSAELENLDKLVSEYERLVDIEADKWFNDFADAVEAAKEKEEDLNEKLHDSKVHLQNILSQSDITFNQRKMSDYQKTAAKISTEFETMYALALQIFDKGGMSGPDLQKTLADLQKWKDQQMQMMEEEWDAKDAAEARRQGKAAADKRKREEETAKKEEAARAAAWQKQLDAWEKEDEAAAAHDEAYFNEEIARMEAEQEKKEEFFLEDIARMDAEKAAEEKLAAEKKALDEEEDKRQKEMLEKKKERTQAAVNISSSGLSALSGMLNAVADVIESTEEDEEKAAEKTKGIKIATTTIETLTGAATALASAMTLGPIAGPIIGGVNAAAVVASGVANIAKIKATPTNGSQSSLPSATSGASVSAPNIPTQLDSVRNITTATEEDRLNRMSNPQKVYILQSDIEAAGQQSRVQVNESSF